MPKRSETERDASAEGEENSEEIEHECVRGSTCRRGLVTGGAVSRAE